MFSKLVRSLHDPVSPYSLGIFRGLFGLMMVIDIPDERGLFNIDERFRDPLNCHFPLIHSWSIPSFEVIGAIYFIMWIGAIGICIGYQFHKSCCLFVLTYWYIFLLDKTAWNNHSYLYGLVSTILLFTSANNYCSVDAVLNPSIRRHSVPVWNYWLLRFQFFLLYFYAGVKKTDPDWIGGHSMVQLSGHWVFDPFRFALNNDEIDYWIIHIFGFLFDLTIGCFLLWDRSRPLAMVVCSSFHLMNSQLFTIGQFPYVCLISTPLFCNYDWPAYAKQSFCACFWSITPSASQAKRKQIEVKANNAAVGPTWKQLWVFICISVYVALQLFLPFSHSFTKGYNSWTNGLYGYSWDMMVHSWDTTLITVTVKDNKNGDKQYLDPTAWVRNTRYSKHADMIVQYATCIKRNLAQVSNHDVNELDVSIYIDVWCSLNNRFQQRMFEPNQDILTAEWDPFTATKWILPLLTDLTPWRVYILNHHSEVLLWNNQTDSVFVSDFPGMKLEHYVHDEFSNVTLSVLQGSVIVEQGGGQRDILSIGDVLMVPPGQFHEVETISQEPSCIVYTYRNSTASAAEDPGQGNNKPVIFGKDISLRLKKFHLSIKNLIEAFNKLGQRIF